MSLISITKYRGFFLLVLPFGWLDLMTNLCVFCSVWEAVQITFSEKLRAACFILFAYPSLPPSFSPQQQNTRTRDMWRKLANKKSWHLINVSLTVRQTFITLFNRGCKCCLELERNRVLGIRESSFDFYNSNRSWGNSGSRFLILRIDTALVVVTSTWPPFRPKPADYSIFRNKFSRRTDANLGAGFFL